METEPLMYQNQKIKSVKYVILVFMIDVDMVKKFEKFKLLKGNYGGKVLMDDT